MKRMFLVLLVLVLAVSAFGCTPENKENTAANDVFTDEYFEGLKQMSLMGLTGPISGEDMQSVIDLLQNVSLSVAGEYLPKEDNSVLLILEFEEGPTKTVSVSSVMIAPGEIGAEIYLVADEEFGAKFMKAFGVGEE